MFTMCFTVFALIIFITIVNSSIFDGHPDSTRRIGIQNSGLTSQDVSSYDFTRFSSLLFLNMSQNALTEFPDLLAVKGK